ncbi:ATP-binding cassette domain-containing protein [Nonomuraea sp. C10]|uniref:ATP-binding cassette domain-containing protein n=1 Tax=Nonomuraea sp. C10 TaxID=2600577 RepID=UPI0021C29284|nr:ATP-binding cassette domain-containing protein [Nonomuraea sp. C10]
MNLAQAAHARPPGDPGGANVLRLADVTVRFGGITAVDAVTLDVPGGQVVGLIGPNGAGKTTLLDSVSGLRTPTEGRIVLDGADVTARTASWLSRHGIRRTFQRHQAFGWLTVRQNVLVPLEWRTRGRGLLGDLLGLPHRRRETEALLQRVDEVVELCGLSDVREYQVAAHCLWEGLEEEAQAILAGLWRRYDGGRRNPYNEIECGDHYVRAMAGWSVLDALAGASYDATSGRLTLAPRGHGRWPLLLPTGWGTLVRDAGGARVVPAHGELRISEIICH